MATPQPPVGVNRFIEEKYSPTQNVEVLSTRTPDRPYTEIAELEVRKNDNAVSLLTKKAKELGADAIILTGERNRGNMALPPPSVGGQPTTMYQQITTLTAIAIKYK